MVVIDLSIPLKLTRSYLYVITVLLFTTCVLFPWSVVLYLKFYSVLIPQTSVHQYQPPVQYIQQKPFIVLDLDQIYADTTKNINYNWKLELSAEFNSLGLRKFSQFEYRVLALQSFGYDDVIMKLLEFHNGVYTEDEWVTGDLLIDKAVLTRANVHGDKVKYFQHGMIFVDEQSKWWWSLWRKPEIISIDSARLPLRPGSKLVVEFNSNRVRISDFKLILIQRLTNLKFLIYNYYYTCLCIGVMSFWCINCFISVLISFIILNKYRPVTKPKSHSHQIKNINIQIDDNLDNVLTNLHNL